MSAENALAVRLLRRSSLQPVRSTAEAAGYDLLYPDCGVSVTIPPGEQRLVNTGVSMQIPVGWYGQIKPRSSLAARGITTDAGVIDSDYRGEIKVIVVNRGPKSHQICPGDKIAQMVLLQHGTFPVVLVQKLTDTVRGAGGFGSTGR